MREEEVEVKDEGRMSEKQASEKQKAPESDLVGQYDEPASSPISL